MAQRSFVRPLLIALSLAALAAGSGCVYRVNIQQGNFLEAKNVDQVVLGMTRSQVRFLLGTPMVADAFHPDRWDYMYYYKEGRSQHVERRELTILFADEKVLKIDRPPGPWKDSKVPGTPGA